MTMFDLLRTPARRTAALTWAIGLATLAPAARAQVPGIPGLGGGGASPEERQKQVEQFRQRIDTRMKEMLRATDEEYAVLRPRIDKIQQIQRANDPRQRGFMMLMAGPGQSWRSRGTGPSERPAGAAEAGATNRPTNPFGETPDTPMRQKTQELQEALEAKDAPDDALKTKLAELRAAREKARTEMLQLQDDLRQLCSVRQESVLVMLGILE